jgi:hypothetical protein
VAGNVPTKHKELCCDEGNERTLSEIYSNEQRHDDGNTTAHSIEMSPGADGGRKAERNFTEAETNISGSRGVSSEQKKSEQREIDDEGRESFLLDCFPQHLRID